MADKAFSFKHLALITLMPLTVASTHATSVYRVIQPDGTVSFSDQPPQNQEAEVVNIKPVQTVPALSDKPYEPDNGGQTPNKTQYSGLKILSPTDQQTFQHPNGITIKATHSSSLKTGHRYQFLANGDVIAESASGEAQWPWPLRGTHTLQVNIVNDEGDVQTQGASITIFVHRPN